VTVEMAANALAISRHQAAKLLARWREQGWLKRLKRGLYVPIPVDAVSAARTLDSAWMLVPQLFHPGYVGGWSAAEHWGLTEQIFHEVCVLSTRALRGRRQDVGEVTFVVYKTRSECLFGTKMIWQGQVRVPISDPHRTLVDMLARPAVGGGMRHTADCLAAYLASPERAPDKLIQYGDELGNGAVFKRLGFLLERSGHREPSILGACRKRLTTGNARLDPALPAERLITRWRLWVSRGWEESSA
jgi:predicted transcriptional regulator of viral defense system